MSMGLLELSMHAKYMLDIQEFMRKQGSFMVPWEVEIYTRYGGIASCEPGQFGNGACKEVICVVHDQNFAYVFWDGEFSYLTEMTEAFNIDLLNRNVSTKAGREKYLDEVENQ